VTADRGGKQVPVAAAVPRAQALTGGTEAAEGSDSQRIARLRSALRRERARGRAGHWTYDLARHLSLAHQLREAENSFRRAAPARH